MSGLKTWILDLRVNFLTGFVFLIHTFTFSVSPIIKELVELDRQNEKQERQTSIPGIPRRSGEISYSYYLIRPFELIRIIKRYHGVGNLFFLVAFLHTSLLTYLGSKAFFQVLVIGKDKELAKLYSSMWYPRLLDNYPNPESFYKLCLMYLAYYVTFRYLCIHRLIKNAILNRNGYKHVTISQANISTAGLYNWTIRSWITFLKTSFIHSKQCATDNQVKRAHLSLETVDKQSLIRNNRRELIYYNNPIDFTKCYGDLMDDMVPYACSWAKHWYHPKYFFRHDISDAGRFFMIRMIGAAGLLALVPIVCLATLIHDMAKLLPNPDQASIYEIAMVFPDFITNLSALIKYCDVLLAILVQFPNHIEVGRIYWDMIVMVSRIRKVHESLSEDLEYCIAKAYEQKHRGFVNSYSSGNYFLYNNISPTDKRVLNELIDLHVRLAQVLSMEFMDLKREHTLYLNLLFVGNGLCISMCISLILSAKSFIVTVLMGGLTLSCFVPIVAVIFCCIVCELDVSTY